MVATATKEVMPPVYSIGHSTRSWQQFLELLEAHGIERLIDVRRYPGSRRYPQFGRDAMHVALAESGIAYVHEPDLGGRRDPEPDSPNLHWRNAQFRGYADYMNSEPFQQALDRLIQSAEHENAVMLCSEAVPWRCHRQLIADVLVARGFEVRHIMSGARADLHVLNPAAEIQPDGKLVYKPPLLKESNLMKDDD